MKMGEFSIHFLENIASVALSRKLKLFSKSEWISRWIRFVKRVRLVRNDFIMGPKRPVVFDLSVLCSRIKYENLKKHKSTTLQLDWIVLQQYSLEYLGQIYDKL